MTSLISTQLNKLDCITQKLHKTQSNILTAIKNCTENKETKYSLEDIDSLLFTIEINSKKIKNMLKQNSLFKEKISAKMDFFICTKKNLNLEQMNKFKEYNDIYYLNNSELKNCLSYINDKNNVKKISNQILINNENYSNIYNELNVINEKQLKSISILDNIINKANQLIEIL